MNKRDLTNDILVDYEGLQAQLSDVFKILDLASMENDINTIMSFLNTCNFALKQVSNEHEALTEKYRKEVH